MPPTGPSPLNDNPFVAPDFLVGLEAAGYLQMQFAADSEEFLARAGVKKVHRSTFQFFNEDPAPMDPFVHVMVGFLPPSRQALVTPRGCETSGWTPTGSPDEADGTIHFTLNHPGIVVGAVVAFRSPAWQQPPLQRFWPITVVFDCNQSDLAKEAKYASLHAANDNSDSDPEAYLSLGTSSGRDAGPTPVARASAVRAPQQQGALPDTLPAPVAHLAVLPVAAARATPATTTRLPGPTRVPTPEEEEEEEEADTAPPGAGSCGAAGRSSRASRRGTAASAADIGDDIGDDMAAMSIGRSASRSGMRSSSRAGSRRGSYAAGYSAILFPMRLGTNSAADEAPRLVLSEQRGGGAAGAGAGAVIGAGAGAGAGRSKAAATNGGKAAGPDDDDELAAYHLAMYDNEESKDVGQKATLKMTDMSPGAEQQ
ncbi:hypothetical protein JCM1841_005611 [Sporobolomyces salmonicolor]